MKTFNSIKEIKKYYNGENNTYEFFEDGELLNVGFTFDLEITANITACNINAGSIKAYDIKARHINAQHIDAQNINAYNINAWEINAWDILYYAVCFAYKYIECLSIKGSRVNAKHFVLDGEIKIIEKEQPKKKVTLELTDEQLEKIKELLKC